MIHFAALALIALLFKVLGGVSFTPLSVVAAGSLFFLRFFLTANARGHVEQFLLQLGVLIYALANQEPSYYEHAALIFCLIPTVARWKRVAQIAANEGTILLLLTYIAWSLSWTSNIEMSMAGLLVSTLCLAFLFSYAATIDGNLKVFVDRILQVLAAILVSSLLAGAMGYGSAGQTFSGVTLHRNQLGFLLGLLILLSLFVTRFRFHWLGLCGVVGGAGFLVYIDSKSAIIAIAMAALAFLVAASKRWKLYLALATICLAGFVGSLPSPKWDHFALAMGRDPTFTSRTHIWADSVKLAAEQPFTGYGYNAVWSAFENRLAQFRDAPGPQYAHAHNAWIDWVLQLGAGGLAIYLLFLGVLLARALAKRASDFTVGLQSVCLAAYIQIYDLANVSTIPVTRFGFFMLAVASLCLWAGSTAGKADWRRFAELEEHTRATARWETPEAHAYPAVRRPRPFYLGLLLMLAALLGVSTFAIWEDGRRFSSVDEQSPPAPNGVAAASYLEAGRFQWKTPEKLRAYAREHRLELQERIGESKTP